MNVGAEMRRVPLGYVVEWVACGVWALSGYSG